MSEVLTLSMSESVCETEVLILSLPEFFLESEVTETSLYESVFKSILFNFVSELLSVSAELWAKHETPVVSAVSIHAKSVTCDLA